MKLSAWIVGLAASVVSVVHAADPVSIRVSPHVTFAPATLVVRTQVEADENNRAVEVTADSDEFYRSSTIPLDGVRAPRTSIFQFRDLPPGEYEVAAMVIGADGDRRAIARTHVTVVASGVSR
jgi:hypothetical protein